MSTICRGDLPAEPSLQQLRHQARDLQRAIRRGDPDALAEAARHHPAGRPDAGAAARFGFLTGRGAPAPDLDPEQRFVAAALAADQAALDELLDPLTPARELAPGDGSAR